MHNHLLRSYIIIQDTFVHNPKSLSGFCLHYTDNLFRRQLTLILYSYLINYIISGTITKTELKEVMKSLGQNPTDKELEQMIKSVDKDNNNEIDFEEFLTLMSSKKPGKDDPDRELKDAFAVFDADGSGTISRSELKKLMKSLGQKLSDAELDAMMDEVDTDGNGEIDFKEFKSMMVRIPVLVVLC